jgi:hypothetical protein
MTGPLQLGFDWRCINAAPEWQARSMRWCSGELVVACPIEGLVMQMSLKNQIQGT